MRDKAAVALAPRGPPFKPRFVFIILIVACMLDKRVCCCGLLPFGSSIKNDR